MTTSHSFNSLVEANNFISTLGEYKNPNEVVPLQGDGAHEVAVGPVHAGVIEPGHFRFQCMGENVYNLQIFLGYQTRGVEEAIVSAEGNLARQIALAETCAGDSSIAAAIAFAEIFENIGRANKPNAHARVIRDLLLELERLANHIGDLGALAGDVAFLPTASFCGRLRGEILNLTARLCGNRFGRNAIIPGGIRIKVDEETFNSIRSDLKKHLPLIKNAINLLFKEPTVLERFTGTGKISKEKAEELNIVGVARRACDEDNGDVLARAHIRAIEIDEAYARVDALKFPRITEEERDAEKTTIENFKVVVSTVNAWRGALIHAGLFDATGALRQYKIVDPSVFNWHALAEALRGEQISNFPICNKSFNLSYCGTDK